MSSRRDVLTALGVASAAALAANSAAAQPAPNQAATQPGSSGAADAFWPNGARIAVSASLMLEAGGQNLYRSDALYGPMPDGYLDLPTNTWFEYGAVEGIPRLLDLFDKHGVKATSFMVGTAVEKHPDLAREIVRRGHEAAAHGRTWESTFALSRADEKKNISDGAEMIEKATGFHPVGWNAAGLRNSANTLEILQELGFLYHIDDVSRDEPFINVLPRGNLVTVPYSAFVNDFQNAFPGRYAPPSYEQLLIDQFDQLYEEGEKRRRMMLICTHDRMCGMPAAVRMLDRVLQHMRQKAGVWFADRPLGCRPSRAHAGRQARPRVGDRTPRSRLMAGAG
jgi:peptidoglycan/xylan/chitin deacetylase (PgdA/CDA1 family)